MPLHPHWTLVSWGRGCGWLVSARNSMESGSRFCVGLVWVYVTAVRSCGIRPVFESPLFSHPTLRKRPFISYMTLGGPPNPSEPLFAHLGNETEKPALQINTLMLQTGTHPAKGWTHPGAQPRRHFQGQQGLYVGKGSPPGPSWLLAWVQPGRSHPSSGLNILGGKAGWNKLPFKRGTLFIGRCQSCSCY